MSKKYQFFNTLDWNVALKYAIQSEKSAQKLLQMLINSLPETEFKINQLLNNYLIDEEHSNSELLLLIHKLHGSCDYCGVLRLKQQCRSIEQQLRAGISAIALFPELLELINEFANIRVEAEKRLAT